MKSAYILALVIVISISGILLFLAAQAPAGESGLSTDTDSLQQKFLRADETRGVTLNPVLPASPEEMMVYTVINGISAGEAANEARSLGFSGKVEERSGTFIDRNNPTDFSVDAVSGSLYYDDSSKGERPDDRDSVELLPSDDEAAAIAKNFLADRGLWPDDAVFRGVTYRPTAITTHRNGTIVASYGLKGIEFSRVIDSIPVYGDVIDVDIGGGGEVLRIFKHWRKIKPYRKTTIIKPDAAYKTFADQKGRRLAVANSTMTIDKVSLGYYSLPPVAKQDLMKPVYAFEGKINSNNNSEPFIEFVAAAPELGNISS